MADGGFQVIQVACAVISRGETVGQVAETTCSVRMISRGGGHSILSMSNGGFQVVQIARAVISRGEMFGQVV
ncbi:hypothetical protein BDW60DRAFT_191079, partial [Aspergillus nidulans var. acristatus]